MSRVPPSVGRSTSPSTASVAGQTVHDLRRRWKPHKERLQRLQPDHPTSIRIHRACSWLQRVEETADAKDLDLAFVSQWVAFNALYGQWDAAKRQTAPDRAATLH